jgi:hypothetical protein
MPFAARATLYYSADPGRFSSAEKAQCTLDGATSGDQGKPPRQPARFVGALKKKQAQQDELLKGTFG